jgi:DNA invertase Pin-like site-specific DNA recombinase
LALDGCLCHGALAQFERRLIQERTKAGLAAARARGRKGGRLVLSPNHPRIVLAAKLFLDKSISSVDAISATLKVSKTTLHRYVVFARRASRACQENPD